MSHSFLRGLGVQRGDDFFYVYSTEKLHTIKFLIVFTLVRLARLVRTHLIEIEHVPYAYVVIRITRKTISNNIMS